MPNPNRPEAESVALEQFLRGERLRALRGAELRARLQYLLAPEPAQPALDPQDHPIRIMVMWRIARATSMMKGLTAEDETLDESTEIAPDPWVHPWMPHMTPTQGAALRRDRVAKILRIHATDGGLALLPPRDPRATDALDRWCNAAAIIARDLGIDQTEEGLLGLIGLLNPLSAWQSDVSKSEVLAFEALILDEALDLILEVGERSAMAHFREHYGLARKEVQGLFRVSKVQALVRTAATIDEKRALQEARLEDFIGRAREALNQDDEMKGMKELAKVQGLTRVDPENQAMEIAQVIRAVAARQDQAMLDSTPDTKQLDVGRAEEVEATVLEPETVDEDDEAAVAEYDQENS